MANLKLLTLSVLFSFLITSCTTSLISTSGGYSDVALNVNSDEFEIIRLKPVTSVSTQLFGIPFDENIGNNFGEVNRFYSFNGVGNKKWMPLATFVSLEVIPVTIFLGGIANSYTPWLAAGLISIPLAAAINNAMWSPVNRAKQRLNRKLIEENPDVDVFLNPKYKIENRWGFFSSESRVTLSAMGATITK
jgi:hypothetical protein